MIKIINLTPHVLNLVAREGNEVVASWPSSGIARVSQAVVELTPFTTVVNGVEVTIPRKAATFGDVVDLPAPVEGTVYFVSAMVKAACPDRSDLVSPGDPVRDAEGKVVGCRSFL